MASYGAVVDGVMLLVGCAEALHWQAIGGTRAVPQFTTGVAKPLTQRGGWLHTGSCVEVGTCVVGSCTLLQARQCGRVWFPSGTARSGKSATPSLPLFKIVTYTVRQLARALLQSHMRMYAVFDLIVHSS